MPQGKVTKRVGINAQAISKNSLFVPVILVRQLS